MIVPMTIHMMNKQKTKNKKQKAKNKKRKTKSKKQKTKNKKQKTKNKKQKAKQSCFFSHSVLLPSAEKKVPPQHHTKNKTIKKMLKTHQ